MQAPEQLWRHRKFPVFSFFLLFFFSFLEGLVLFLSFAFKGQLVYLVFPKLKLEDTPFLHLMKVSSVRRSTWIQCDMKGKLLSAAVPRTIPLRAGGESGHFTGDGGMGWGGQRVPLELAGRPLREGMCRNLAGLIAWKLETLQLGNWK